MTIPKNLREQFFSRMSLADNTLLPVEDWLHEMLAAAEEFLAEHHLDEEPRGALVYYVKHLDRVGDDD